MRTRTFITILITILAMPLAARAIDQVTLDHMVFLLGQPEVNAWDNNNTFTDAELYEGLEMVFQMVVEDDDQILLAKVIWAMGETGIGIFDETLIGIYDGHETAVLAALGKIPSEAGVEFLIEALDDEDRFVREAAAWGLGNVPYDYGLDEAGELAIDALNARLEVEEEEFIIDMINAAIAFIDTGVATSVVYEDEEI